MGFDAYDSPQAGRFRESWRLRAFMRAPRLSLTEFTAALLVLTGVGLLALIAPDQPLHPASLVIAAVIYLAADQVTFPAGPAETSASQIAFVPLLVLVPLAWAPALIVLLRVGPTPARALRLRRRRGDGGDSSVSVGSVVLTVFTRIGDCAYCLGPVAVLALFHPHGFRWPDWPIYLVALLAQFGGDLVAGVGRTWLAERIHPREVLPVVAWLYLVDAALSCAGLFVAAVASTRPGLALLILPVIGLFVLFSRERRARVQSVMDLSDTYRETAELLGDVLEDDDAPTGAHSRAVADLALRIAARLGLDPVTSFNVRYGALLHDVGKITIAKSILLKPGPLDPDEWAEVREHAVRGQEMLDRLGGSLVAVGGIVRHSHERWDGTGYPDGLAGEEIPLASRIIAAADAWHAMTTDRPYRRAGSVEVAAEELARQAGHQFDPAIALVLLVEVAPVYVDLLAPRPRV